jgi:hypothetical protein
MQDIEAEVMRVYPKTKKERTCGYERQRLDELRNILRQRLINEQRAKGTILREAPQEDTPL